MNNNLKEQLAKAIKENKINVKYSKGHREWKAKFDYFYNITKSVPQALEIIYGPGGSVNNYQGSLYNNSNFDIKTIKQDKKKPKKSNKSNTFGYLRIKNQGER